MTTVFKVFSIDENTKYKSGRESGQTLFKGSELDLKDGFIHMSDSDMANEVVNLFFKDHETVFMVEFLIPLDDPKLEKLPGMVPNSFCYHYHEVSSFLYSLGLKL
jgi:uncharacterized protein (DUF952 family)